MGQLSQKELKKIGPIPEGWSVLKLGEVGEFKNGINKDKDQFGFGFPFVNLNDVFNLTAGGDNLSLVNSTIRELEEFSLKEGDVLFIRSSVKPSGVGLTCMIEKDLVNTVYSGFIIRYRSNGSIIKNFKNHCFSEEGFRKRLISKSTISANTNINQPALKSLIIKLPPKPEQQKIAEILSTWDDGIGKTQNLISQLHLRKKGLMQELLTGNQRLPGFGGEWKELKAGVIFENHSDKSHDGEFEVLSATQDKGVIPRSEVGIDIKYDKSSLKNYKKVDAGDFVISLRSFQGGIEYSSYEGLVSPAYTVLKEKLPISKKFYAEYLKSGNFIQRLNSIIYGIRDGKQISYKEFSSLKLWYPPIDEQNHISTVLEIMDKEIGTYKTYLETQRIQKRGLMQELLTGKKRVKI